jgi:hypothetical protein
VGTGWWFGLAVGTGWWFGLAVGAAHALIAACAMPMMSAVHPRAGATAAPGAAGVRLPTFGFGGRSFGAATPAGPIGAHLVYGVVWGLVFAVLIG